MCERDPANVLLVPDSLTRLLCADRFILTYLVLRLGLNGNIETLDPNTERKRTRRANVQFVIFTTPGQYYTEKVQL